ncbi:sortase [Candidatus Peregrinibacteria bacterium]|nr:sortase [Candidatus Peregrinibacteria bacterium]
MNSEEDNKLYTIHIDHESKKDPNVRTVLSTDNDLKQEKDDTRPTLGDKIWSTLRFLSSSAIIFIVIFFAMNWNAYSTIIMNKFGFLKPAAEEEIDEQFPNEEQLPTIDNQQELMDLSKDPEVQKTQMPPLALNVAPPDTRIIIPRINKNVPVITVSSEALLNRDWVRLEQEIQEALQDGVVHYPSTAFPDESGNTVITGHSSYFPWDPGRFKDVFALLHDVQVGDKIYMYYNQKRYDYEVYETKVVLPSQVEVLTQDGEDKLTLITCTPVGTNLKRLVVTARPI